MGEKVQRAVVHHVFARSLRRPFTRGGRPAQVLLFGGPHVPKNNDDSLQNRRPQQRQHPPRDQAQTARGRWRREGWKPKAVVVFVCREYLPVIDKGGHYFLLMTTPIFSVKSTVN